MTVWAGKRSSIRPHILKRDDFTCQKCFWKATKVYEISRLHIHHIDGRHEDHSFKNLITLCITCHGKEKIHHQR